MDGGVSDVNAYAVPESEPKSIDHQRIESWFPSDHRIHGKFRRMVPMLEEWLRSRWNPARAMPDATIHTHGRILENRGPVLYRVSLPNGKIILAHLSKPLADESAEFQVDDLVLLEMTPYDFDQARILGSAG